MSSCLIDTPIFEQQSAAIEIGPLDFDGPFISHLELKEQPGILATLVRLAENYQLVNVYSTANLRSAALLELSCLRQNNPNIVVASFSGPDLKPEISAAMASLVWQSLD